MKVSSLEQAIGQWKGRFLGAINPYERLLTRGKALLAKRETLVEQLDDALKTKIRSALPRKQSLPGWSARFLAHLNPIQTVVDVGVLDGTPALYAAFPDAYLVLVEALPQYAERCKKIVTARPGEAHMVAAGDVDGETMIRYYPDYPATSSIVAVAGSTKRRIEEVTVPIRRLDTLLGGRTDLKGPILLKVDTEGLEDRVVQGASSFLSSVSYCILEASIKKRHKDSYRFADLVALMKERGFDLFDVLTVTRQARDQPRASIMDAVFINSRMLES